MKWSTRRERMNSYAHEYPYVTGSLIVALIAIIVILAIYLTGGFKAEPPYTTWCDSPSVQDGQSVANRIYQSHTGDITVVPVDKTC